MQRFGTGTVRTYLVGSAILRGDFKEAAHLILAPRPGAEGDSAPACKAFADGEDIQQVLEMMPRRCVVERLLLQNLIKVGKNNFTDAIGTVRASTLV